MTDTTNLPNTELHSLRGHSGPIHAITYSQDGNYILTASHDRSAKLWNPTTGLLIKTYEAHGKGVLAVAVPPAGADNSRFVTGSEDRSVFVWDVGTGRPIRRFQGHHSRVNAVAFNQDGTVIISGSYDASIRFWDCRAANARLPIQICSDAKDSVESVRVVGSEVLTGSVDGSIRIYDIRMGSLTADAIGHPITSATFSGDKNCILLSSLDSTIRLIDKETGELLNHYRGHKNTTYRLASTLSNNDAYVVSGSEDGKIYMWDLVDGKLVKAIVAHEGSVVTAVAYHPISNGMVSAAVDGSVKVWTE
ncbi:WD40-repeat-containing domain protein [Fimicolochytrium jonesii]|uniref:WD40-repeat-containing domain protein n=1 Tax=Fimicolochytrium jonesii TaxID=1396493 RepID=UPI0022FE1EED|nr:WD40-repeat-containing domain protein [Fimicolochytrium jonesii]KAI8815782.1 WD40-repeat-containing domain protein [Fimicolochytrium jonesii]